MLRDPPTFPAMGRVRDELEGLRCELEAALARADAEMAEVIDRRIDLAERIHACNRALAGTGLLTPTDRWAGDRLFWPRAPDYVDPLDATAATAATAASAASAAGGPSAPLRPLSSAALQHALVALLRHAGRPLTITDLRRLLTAHGLRPRGERPSKAIANALRRPVHLGLVERRARGCYRWTGATDAGTDDAALAT